MRKRTKLITSFFYLGHSPYMPGTVGSLGGLIVYYLVKDNLILHGFSILFLLMLGTMFSAEAERIYKVKDPKMIVIDEACGMVLALFFVPHSIAVVILGFILFRIFDILKVPPARRIEKMSGAFGIMFDDIIAAIYTNIILQLLTRAFHLL
ncbi:MAG: phosphatidylglycerophosphatase A [Candidatus Omnitrophica bacterium]|nr:phosphatidylglycerophosphatase A [Candidatus Omnitrophota bacterium]